MQSVWAAPGICAWNPPELCALALGADGPFCERSGLSPVIVIIYLALSVAGVFKLAAKELRVTADRVTDTDRV